MARVIAVTGSTGFVGGQLVRHLLDLGHEVVGLDRRVPQWGAERFADVAAELACPDGDVRAVLGSAEAVVHLAACPGVRDAGPDVAERRRRDNVEATDAVLALTPATTPTVVTSSSSVYGGTVDGRASHEDDVLRPVGGYAESKALVELRCAQRRDEGGHVTVVRPFTVVGPGQRPDMALSRWIEQARRGQPLEVFGSLDRRRDVTDVRDVARALAALIEVPPSTVNLGTGISRTLGELVAAVHQVFGDTGLVVVEPPVAEPDATCADTRRLHALVGFTPVTDVVGAVVAQAEHQVTAA